ncbi:MAG: BlaI/MecI/CopY family transcriptional regulator [Bacteroidales bacterium]|nr:BlaI/MecI/CopY family transcriptional regulator [Bacteroidales bacterium]
MKNEEIKNKSLTKAELNLMNILWDKGRSTVNELVEALPDPKPAYTTVLTVMQVLTKKQVLTFEKQGKANIYIPLLSRKDYLANFMDETRDSLFKGSAKSFLSFFAKHEKISKAELEEILKEMADN